MYIHNRCCGGWPVWLERPSVPFWPGSAEGGDFSSMWIYQQDSPWCPQEGRQKQLSIIGIAMIGKTMRVDNRAQRSGVNGKEKWSHHRALGHPCSEAVRYRQLPLP